MEQQDSIKGELQTLITLEQQQNQTLDAIHSKGAFNPTAAQVNGFGFGASHYAPSAGGFQKVPVVGEYMNQMNSAINYANNLPGIEQMNSFSQRVRNAAVVSNLESANWASMNQSKLSMEAREVKGANIGEKLATGTLGAASIFSGWAGQTIGGALGTGAIGGILGGIAGGAVAGAAADIAVDQTKQTFAYNRYLAQNSYRFINPFESKNDRNVSGFSRNERWDTSNWLRKFNTEMKISDNDTMTLLKGFTEGDLLRDVSDVDTFKKKMTDLTKSVKTMALSLNETYEEVVQTMADLKKAGLNTRDYKSIAGFGKVTAALTGQDAGDVVNYQTNLAAALNRGTSLDVNKTMSLVQGTESFISALYTGAEQDQNNEKLNQEQRDAASLLFNRINGRNGIEGATSDYLQISKELLGNNGTWFNQSGAAFYDWDENSQSWKFNKDTYNSLKNSSLTEISQIATQKMAAAGNTAIQNWTNNSGNIMMGDFGSNLQDLAGLFETITNAAKQTAGYNGWSTEAVMESLFGIKGEDSKFMSQITDSINARPELFNQINAMSFAQTMADNVMSNRVGVGYGVKNWWEKQKDNMGDLVSPVANFFSQAGQNISDLWYGGITDMNLLRERWGKMDWTSSPAKGLEDALAKFAEASKNAGSSDSDVNKILGLTGKNADLSDRDMYSSIDKLAKALSGLADNADEYAKIIRNAADESNVSENVAAAALSTLGAKDANSGSFGKNIISQLSSYKKMGYSDEEALRNILKAYNASDEDINNAVNGLKDENSVFHADTTESTINKNQINTQTEKFFGSSNNRQRSKAANLSDDLYSLWGGLKRGKALAEVLGVESDDEFRLADAILSNVDNSARMIKSGKWNDLTLQEQNDRAFVIRFGMGELQKKGLTSKAIEEMNQDGTLFKDIVNTENMADSVPYLLLNTDEKKEYYKQMTGNKAITGANFDDFLRNGSMGYYDNGTPSEMSKYGDMTVDKAINAIKNDLNPDSATNKIKYAAQTKLLSNIVGFAPATLITAIAAHRNESTSTKNSARKANEDLVKAKQKLKDSVNENLVDELSSYLDSGDVSANTLVDKYKLNEGDVSSYMSAKDTADKQNKKVDAEKELQLTLENYKEESAARADAYTMLGGAIGMDTPKLNQMKKNLSKNNLSKLTLNQANSLFDNAREALGQQMFGDYIGATVDDSNRDAIIGQLTKSLSSSGIFKQEQVASLVSSYAEQSLTTGAKINGDNVNAFMQSVMGTLTNGTGLTETSKLNNSMDKLTSSVDAATEAIKGIPFWKDKDGNNDSGNNKNSQIDVSSQFIDNSVNSTQVNGTASSSSSGYSGRASRYSGMTLGR